ncbi:hypothetical protein ACNKHV_16905 [Shigella flexneri]
MSRRSTASKRLAEGFFLQLLTIETVFVHHFVDELLGIRVIAKSPPICITLCCGWSGKPRRRSGGRISLGRVSASATGGKQHGRGSNVP